MAAHDYSKEGAEQHLALACGMAEEQVAMAEAGVATTQARLRLADCAIARIRAVAAGCGIQLRTPPSTATDSSGTPSRMSVREFALQQRISERTMRKHLKGMSEGREYHRDGRRIIVHTVDAEAYLDLVLAPKTEDVDADRIAIDEVTRRRARVAQKQLGTGGRR